MCTTAVGLRVTQRGIEPRAVEEIALQERGRVGDGVAVACAQIVEDVTL
jgi:hypothetical protein